MAKQPANPLQFKSPAHLRRWLDRQGIDLSGWGQAGTKTVDSLWHELNNGEVTLQTEGPVRTVSVAQVFIHREGQILIEVEQILEGNRRRARNYPPSEKMMPGESVREAALRCLDEELQVSHDDVQFWPDSYRRREELKESPSYPGLPTRYTFHVVDVTVRGLPEEDFWREETGQAAGDPVKVHHWRWCCVADANAGHFSGC